MTVAAACLRVVTAVDDDAEEVVVYGLGEAGLPERLRLPRTSLSCSEDDEGSAMESDKLESVVRSMSL